MITCRVLGPVELSLADAPAPPELLWRKHLALLIYLAHSPQGTRSRDHLVALLWGEKPESAARHSLSEALRIVRRHLGEDALTTGGGQVRLSTDKLDLDTMRFERHMGQGQWQDAAVLIAGEFMEGFSVSDSWEFEEWLAGRRSDWRRLSVDAFVRAADASLDSGALDRALMFGSRALTLEPTSDAACRAVMRALALNGNRAAALERFARFEGVLDEELGLEADDETRALADRIREERSWRPPAPAPASGVEARRQPLIGRDDELGRLLAQWLRARASRVPRVVMVDGEPGAGKSRLAEELVARARLDGGTTVMVRAVAADRAQPWSTAGVLLRGNAADVTAGDVPSFVRGLRDAARGGELLLVIDDAQHADADSIRAISGALRDLRDVSLLVLLVCGPFPPSDMLDELRSRIGRDVEGEVLCVGPLNATALRELCRWNMPDYDDLQIERLARRIALDSAGLPLLASELLHAVSQGLNLRDSPAAAWPEPARTVDHTLPGVLPEPLVAAIRVNFRKTSVQAQQVLSAAAVLEERASIDMLAKATALSEDDLTAALDELEWRRWVVGEPRGYTFVARLARDVVQRDMVTSAQRARMLSRVQRS